MNVPAEDRVKMSLEDLIKANRKAVGAQKKAKDSAKSKRRPRKDSKGSAGSGAMEVDAGSASKVAKSIGTGKAKRAAATNKKRGINASGQATKAEIDVAVAKQQRSIKPKIGGQQPGRGGAGTPRLKKRPGSGGSGGRAPSGRAPGGGAGTPGKTAGLKISFRPAELNKTTDKVVTQQILAALGKQNAKRFQQGSGGGSPAQSASSRSVSIPGSGGGGRGKGRQNGGGLIRR